MKDFTLTTYKKLLQELLANGYSFQTLQDFIQQPEDKTVMLRHDVDRLPENALKTARIENDAGVKASYYFRIVKESYDEDIIRQIAEMGHEIGYHYENLSEISKKNPQITPVRFSEPTGQAQTFIRQTRPPCLSESDGGQASPDKKSRRFAKKSQKDGEMIRTPEE